jgi:hypothetical protein
MLIDETEEVMASVVLCAQGSMLRMLDGASCCRDANWSLLQASWAAGHPLDGAACTKNRPDVPEMSVTLHLDAHAMTNLVHTECE